MSEEPTRAQHWAYPLLFNGRKPRSWFVSEEKNIRLFNKIERGAMNQSVEKGIELATS